MQQPKTHTHTHTKAAPVPPTRYNGAQEPRPPRRAPPRRRRRPGARRSAAVVGRAGSQCDGWEPHRRRLRRRAVQQREQHQRDGGPAVRQRHRAGGVRQHRGGHRDDGRHRGLHHHPRLYSQLAGCSGHPLLSGQCRVVVATPLLACNVSLAGVTGTLTAPLQLLNSTTGGGGIPTTITTIFGWDVTVINGVLCLIAGLFSSV
ncbi:hypothetical protein PAHAL_9G471900 [Panicum hallii]|uniref:Uncharacterized protein n=1 Tax=Panicum hallii TaxID=206008 RepID=A0A2T8I4Y3_9POAL|nr:hypothetical protein PAHAL_9G471900 [Panicum hallii]